MTDFTLEQIENWRSFERVRLSGRFNMFDPNARRATGLTPEEYRDCMKHYSELEAAAQEGA